MEQPLFENLVRFTQYFVKRVTKYLNGEHRLAFVESSLVL